MIISAPYRSGGTTLAIRLANEYSLKFVGQIDSNSIEFTKIEDKNSIHEYSNQPMHTFGEIDSWLSNNKDVCILNNSNPALLKDTDVFIRRKDFYRCYSSIYWMMNKLHNMQPMQVEYMFRRITYFNAMFLTHVKARGIQPLYLEEQSWYTATEEHTIPDIIKHIAYRHVQYLKGLE